MYSIRPSWIANYNEINTVLQFAYLYLSTGWVVFWWSSQQMLIDTINNEKTNAHEIIYRLGYVYRLGWILRWINRNWTSASEIRSDFIFEPNQKRVQFRIHKPNKIKDQFSGSFVRIYIYLTDYSSNKCQSILKVVS